MRAGVLMLKLRYASILFLLALLALPLPASAQQQPTGITFTSSPNYIGGNHGYPGVTTRTVTVANGANMTVQVKYKVTDHCPDNSNPGDDWLGTIQTDANGQQSYAFGHYE